MTLHNNFLSQTSLWLKKKVRNESSRSGCQQGRIWDCLVSTDLLLLQDNLELGKVPWKTSLDIKSVQGTCYQPTPVVNIHLPSMLNASHWGDEGHGVQAEQKHLKHFAAKVETHWRGKDWCKASAAHPRSMAILHSLPVLRDGLPMYFS